MRWTEAHLLQILGRKRTPSKAKLAEQPGDPLVKGSKGVRWLLWQLRAKEMPVPVLEHRFDFDRRWRFDLAWPDDKIAVEVEGGIWIDGRHVRGKGFEADAIKYNRAQMLGWKVFRYSTGQVKNGVAIADLEKVLA